ncbi:MAG: transposase [Sutterella wadsworthensis]
MLRSRHGEDSLDRETHCGLETQAFAQPGVAKETREVGTGGAFDKKQPSRKRRRLKERLQNLYRKIRCIRQDFHRKTAHALAQEYGCVYVEDLEGEEHDGVRQGHRCESRQECEAEKRAQPRHPAHGVLQSSPNNRMATSESGWCDDSR